jgi:hypothetical protein
MTTATTDDLNRTPSSPLTGINGPDLPTFNFRSTTR